MIDGREQAHRWGPVGASPGLHHELMICCADLTRTGNINGYDDDWGIADGAGRTKCVGAISSRVAVK